MMKTKVEELRKAAENMDECSNLMLDIEKRLTSYGSSTSIRKTDLIPLFSSESIIMDTLADILEKLDSLENANKRQFISKRNNDNKNIDTVGVSDTYVLYDFPNNYQDAIDFLNKRNMTVCSTDFDFWLEGYIEDIPIQSSNINVSICDIMSMNKPEVLICNILKSLSWELIEAAKKIQERY